MKWTRSGLAVAVTLAGLSALAACGRGGEAAEREGAGGPGGRGGMANRVVPVETVAAERGSIARAITVSGVIQPIRTVGVNSQLPGALLSVHVEEGDVVRRGTIMARLDDRELRAQLASAQASFQVAEAAYERAEQLRERKVITLPEYERDRTAFAAATAQLEQLRTRIGYATVVAPTRGVVTEKNVETGDVVGSQTRLFTLADVDTLVVRVGVSELDVVELAVGSPAQVTLDAFPGRALQGRIRRIFPTADPSTRLVPVEVALVDPGQMLRPGYLARVTFALGAREGVLLVPANALVSGAGSTSVFVVDQGRALRRSVATGLTSEGRVEVTAGLEEGEAVITAGNSQLRDGAQVRVVEGPAGTPVADSGAAQAAAPGGSGAP